MKNRGLLWLAVLPCLGLLTAVCGETRDAKGYGKTPRNAARAASAKVPPATGKPFLENFDGEAAGKPPSHFSFARTGQGAEGSWVVKEDPTAPSKPNVLAQLSADTTDYRFPLAIREDGAYQDVAVSVKFKAVSGKVDQAGGIVFRLQDPNNYYIVRANALENNYRLYHVVAGRRQQFAGANFHVTGNQWHTLRVIAVGNQLKCYYDGELKITATDNTFAGAGKVGLWTKADSVTYFDDFELSKP